jgi:hypothetical protein
MVMPAPDTGHALGNGCALKGSSQRLVDQFMLSRREVGDDETVFGGGEG